MSGIFVEIGEAQEKFQHAIALFRIRMGRPFLEIGYDRKSI
jgi:hypothetical protein